MKHLLDKIDIMTIGENEGILDETRFGEGLIRSSVVKVLQKNLKKTDKGGNGPVIVTTGGARLTVSIYKNDKGKWDNNIIPGTAKEMHRIFAKVNPKLVWTVEDARGVAKNVIGTKKNVDDATMVKAVEAIFNKV